MQILHLFPNMQFLQFGQTTNELQSKDPVMCQGYTLRFMLYLFIY